MNLKKKERIWVFKLCFDYINNNANILLCCLVTKLCLILCNTMDCSPPGSSVHGISQARILELVAISFSRGYFQPRDQTCISCLAGGFFITEPSALV